GMLHAHAHEPLVPSREFTEGVPPDLRRVVLRCLEKDPDRRFQDASALERALAACEGVAEWTAERAEEWWRWNGAGNAAPSAPEAGQRAPQAIPADCRSTEDGRALEGPEARPAHRPAGRKSIRY